MKLFDVVNCCVTKEIIGENVEIKSICFDSRKAEEGCLFVCLEGEKYNGKNFIKEAINKGAVAVCLTEKIEGLKVSQVICENERKALSFYSANFNLNPEKKLKIVGVVGTNGKTSTCHILKHIISSFNKKVAVIGTIGIYFNGIIESSNLTTLDPPDLFKIFKRLVEKGCEYVIMEVSAHGIYYQKVAPIFFECLIFTNCTHDHLDFFQTFENYAMVKKSIFSNKNAKFLLVNSDDKTCRSLLNLKNIYSYGIYEPSDVFAVNVKESVKGCEYVINLFDSIYHVKTNLLGLFNVYNCLGAIVCAKILGFNAKKIVESLISLPPVSGRMELVATVNGGRVFVDYAHTPDGLENVLISLRKVTKNNLFCLFGCGGNRDRSKRKIMGKIAGDIADYVIITSDNPRFEEPVDIMKQIEFGVRESSLDYICIVDRKKAIKYALENLQNGDTLLIAGKGAEAYQEILGVKHTFSDKEVVLEFLNYG